MFELHPSLQSVDYLNLLSLSAIFVVILIITRLFLERRIHERFTHWTEEQRLKAIGTVRNGSFALLFLGLVYIWGAVVRDFAVSVFAIALAMVVATKELILCVHGYILILRNSLYHLGDRIEIDGKRGDVTNITVLSTTILEVGPMHNGHQRTGRQIAFPNSLVLNNFTYNESAFENFALITISIPLHIQDDWELAKTLLLEYAHQECAPYLDSARRKIRQAQKRTGIELPIVDPRVHVDITGPDRLVLQLRLPCPFHLRERVEQAILSAFLRDLSQMRVKSGAQNNPTELPVQADPSSIENGSNKESSAGVKLPIIG